MYIVYVLRSQKDGNLYIGCTSNLEQRLKTHEAGHVRSTKSRRPFSLIYSELYEDKVVAYQIEKYYKTAIRKRVLKKKFPYSEIV